MLICELPNLPAGGLFFRGLSRGELIPEHRLEIRVSVISTCWTGKRVVRDTAFILNQRSVDSRTGPLMLDVLDLGQSSLHLPLADGWL